MSESELGLIAIKEADFVTKCIQISYSNQKSTKQSCCRFTDSHPDQNLGDSGKRQLNFSQWVSGTKFYPNQEDWNNNS